MINTDGVQCLQKQKMCQRTHRFTLVSASKRSRWMHLEILMKKTTNLALTRTANRYLPLSTSAVSATRLPMPSCSGPSAA